MFGEPDMGEPSTFRLCGVPGRMFTGLVGVDMSAGMKKAGDDWQLHGSRPGTRDTPPVSKQGGEFYIWKRKPG